MSKDSAAATPIRTDPHVMVIEDEPRLRELLVQAIGGWGFDVSSARSGEEALRLADAAGAAPPDIVLLDLNLPGIDGLKTFQQLRERHPSVQGIVLTGFGSLEAARQAIRLEVVEFLTKPAPLGELEQALDRAMRRLAPPTPSPMVGELAGADPDESDNDANASGGAKTLEEVERDHILAALRRNNGNRTATAIELGISRRTLYYKLGEYEQKGYVL